jgi:hypothetical protein
MDKYCSGCTQRKPYSLFSKNKAMKDGYANWCKPCLKQLWQRPENLLRRKERRLLNYASTLYIETKSRAKLSNIPFNLDKSDIFIPEFCPVLGIPLIVELHGRTDNTPTIDKIIPSKGYMKGNVKVISWLANLIKRDCTNPEVFEKIAIYIRSSQDE